MATARERKPCGCYVRPEKIEEEKVLVPCARRECRAWDWCLDAGRQGEVGFGEKGNVWFKTGGRLSR